MKIQNFLFLFFIFFLSSCQSDKHLLFKNIPISGNFRSFADKLVKTGFTEKQLTEDKQISLKGVFLDKYCDVYVYGTKKSQTTYMVRVNLPDEVHDSIKYSYERLQRLYASLYGKGISKYQQFNNSPRFLFNEPKLIREPKTGDYTRYDTPSGTISLEVMLDYISIIYLDKRNDKIREKEEETGKTVENN